MPREEPVPVTLKPEPIPAAAPEPLPTVVDADPALVEAQASTTAPEEPVAAMPSAQVSVAAAKAALVPALDAVPVPVAVATPNVESVMIAMPPVAPPPMLAPVTVVAEQPAPAPALPTVVLPAPKLPQWRLEGGKPIDAQLQTWAESSGWKLDWRLDKTWLPPADVFYEGSFDVVIEKIITGLHAEGESVRLTLWSGNRYAEVVHADVK